ncbi:MAG: 16S rRNA (uracil(1498)-N(3))-methyltransferase [Chitinophagales bacterium]
MQLFYAPNIQKGELILDAVQSKHCVKVLRHQEGSHIHLVDGLGGFYEAKITDSNPKKCYFQIVKEQQKYGKMPFGLHIAIAPTKNMSRFEWFLEKATEIGITEITPLLTRYAERRNVRLERLEKIVIAAMKQSLKAYKPIINNPLKIKDLCKKKEVLATYNFKAIAHLQANTKPLQSIYQKGQNALILIGPEGGFHADEIAMCLENGFASASLGKSRLRTETAALVACHTVGLRNEI